MRYVLLILFSFTTHAEDCATHLRALFDVGAANTKLNLSEVDVCGKTIQVRRVLDDQTSLDVPLEANKDESGNITDKGLELLLTALKTLKAKAIEEARKNNPAFKLLEVAAVGTHTLRTARNQSEVIERVATLGIPLVALSQKEEALADFESVQAKGIAICGNKRLLVWDVGSGSMEWTLAGEQKPFVSGLPLGAETFKSRLIGHLKLERHPKCPVKVTTPNPIGRANSTKAIELAVQEAMALPPELKTLRPEDICLVGVGGAHNKAIANQVEKQWEQIRSCVCGKSACMHTTHGYTRRELDCLTDLLAEKSDCDPELQGPNSATSVSDLILIQGFLQEMNLSDVHTETINIGQGLITDRRYLRFQSQPVARP